MNQPHFKNKELYLILGLIVLVIGLFAFKSKNSIKNNVSDSIFDHTLSYNNSFEQLPEPYERFTRDEPIDIILDSTQGRFERIKALKFDAHFFQNKIYREVVLIKKATPNDTLIESIRLDIYPTERKKGERKYITYSANTITYSHNGLNYYVAKQVLPNIEIAKIVPYTKNWQTAIPTIDNSILSSKEVIQSRIKEQGKIDSLTIGLNTETSAYELLFAKTLGNNRIPYISAGENFKETDVLKNSESFNAYLKEKGLQLVYIEDDISFWESLTQRKSVPEVEYLNLDNLLITPKFMVYIEGGHEFEEVFDIEKLATYYSLLSLYSNRTNNSLYLNYNEKTGLLEPFHVTKDLGRLNTYIKNLKIQDITFAEQYAQQLAQMATLQDVQELVSKNRRELKEILEVTHQNNPKNLFEMELFQHNKLVLEKSLNPSTITKMALVRYDENQIEVEIQNLTNFPLEVEELSYKQEKFITGPPIENLIIMPSEKTKVVFSLPDSYDNLFVQKKKKTTGFVFEKDIFSLSVGYRLVGTFGVKYNEITPFKDLDELSEDDDLLRVNSDLSQFEFIAIDEENKEIKFASDSIVLSSPLLLPAGYVVNAKSGLQIDIKSGGKIISKSPLNFQGSKEKPIKIHSSDRKGQGIFVVSAKETSELNYVEFDNLTNQTHGLWDLTGAVVFYESPVNLDHVLIADNSCEDGLNIIRTHFTMKNTTFRNTQSDAFDGDFVQGTLTNCTFENLGNDAVDVSGSKLEMYDLKIIKAGDKALSAGEDSVMKAERITIDQCEIAVAGKDLSIVEVQGAKITNSKLGFTAFQKKPEFGASNITADNVKMTQVETEYLIENKSSLLLNGEQAETIEAVKEQMYGVEFGVDSKETRVKKTQ
ncbi:hypothetical protein FEE95_05795 [Maribacter algarum]|uniref:Right-handed parallel beta-helix repeat-containing protein n=1 Tax=Maribacter algarum (ex Zhang et al. 2020) TaxID=2578118 RepID=A0A5S3QM20_9FLAO|nr:hypothetical protein [Maribacter algarum]TMM58944.1 hypothetical protein FEE95_05795 [Maribacter algarum]